MNNTDRLNVVEIELDISFNGGTDETVLFGVVADETYLTDTDNYENDDNIFYYLTLNEYYRVCSGEQITNEWKVV